MRPGSAVFSDCMRYRYLLTRDLADGAGTCLFVMLNPSTATEAIDDPTIRRCTGFAKSWGFRRLEVVNLFAGRAVTPGLLFAMKDPCGPENDAHIAAASGRADLAVVAWGNHGNVGGRDREVMSILLRGHARPSCLGLNRGGAPRHPLYAPAKISPEWFS